MHHTAGCQDEQAGIRLRYAGLRDGFRRCVTVDYDPLPVIVDPHKALLPGAVVLRPDRGEDKQNNRIWHWESGDAAKADAARLALFVCRCPSRCQRMSRSPAS